eukprot:CAMPEP_0206267586 /NCGR_PEP_ID=MMETSP0047_2-20121206/31231_1 /ASSEMBLY_ACC=CAM_ASM_000192 /TAXON_ID=195065 /ORGANISM="Chroomonas mesostigmatica_cf, Strain CCMP1168" /LENGTH=50 /DNA_ID=CAMNT_0053695805 /DNA_START=54 /DNA_END=206 /DNA_ORIENTATION=+
MALNMIVLKSYSILDGSVSYTPVFTFSSIISKHMTLVAHAVRVGSSGLAK